MGLFQKKDSAGGSSGTRPPRQSTGWRDILKHLSDAPGLRVLDFGATSPNNINLLTGMGHSVYMANVVQDAARPEWRKPDPEKEGAVTFDVQGFVDANLNFSGREFDVVLLWDTADYLPPEVVPALFHKLHDVLRPAGHLLAFFHGSAAGAGTVFLRYQLSSGPELTLQGAGNYPVLAIYQNRQVEAFLADYASTRFILGKDNIREVIAVR